MTDDDRSWPSDVEELQELFVDVTGEEASTDAQAPERGRGVVHTTEDGPARPEDVDAEEAALVDSPPGRRDDVIDGRPDDVDG